MFIRNCGLPTMRLDKCLKRSFSDHPSTGNIANGLKDCSTLNDSTFTLFANHYEANCVGKSLF